MQSSLFINSKVSSLKEYLHTANQWFSQTPDRALEQAYQAVVKIKAFEDEYFDGGEIATTSTPENEYLMPISQAYLEKFLRIAKLRLAEFQLSYSVVGSLIPDYLEKLKFIDDVIGKYATQKHTSSVLPPFLTSKNNPNPANNLLPEDNLEVAGYFGLPTQSTETETEPHTPPFKRQPARSWVTQVGLASTLMAGGFAAGIASSSALLSPHHATENNKVNQHSLELHPNHAVAHSNSTHMQISPSAPETLPPSSASFSPPTHIHQHSE